MGLFCSFFCHIYGSLLTYYVLNITLFCSSFFHIYGFLLQPLFPYIWVCFAASFSMYMGLFWRSMCLSSLLTALSVQHDSYVTLTRPIYKLHLGTFSHIDLSNSPRTAWFTTHTWKSHNTHMNESVTHTKYVMSQCVKTCHAYRTLHESRHAWTRQVTGERVTYTCKICHGIVRCKDLPWLYIYICI